MEFNQLQFKLGSRRHLPLARRDIYGISQRELVTLRQLSKLIDTISEIIRKVAGEETQKLLKLMQLTILAEQIKILSIDPAILDVPRPFKRAKLLSTDDFDRTGFSEIFRFRNPEDCQKLCKLLELPDIVRTERHYVFSGEEVLMISLARLAYPLRWRDVNCYFPDRKRWQLSDAFYWFLDFLISNWGYLVTNNREFWLPYFKDSANAIRGKLSKLPYENWRLYFPDAADENGFAIFGFIDNTVVAMCCPGGGGGEGESAPRVDPEVQ